MKLRPALLCMFLALSSLAAPVSAAAQDSLFGLDDLGRLVNVADPQIAPDGGSVVIVTSRPDYDENRFERQLVLVDLPDGGLRSLTYGRPGVRSPRWSPDGSAIGFISSGEDDRPQVHVLSLGGGEARQVTSSPTGVSQFAWRPNGQDIAYVAVDSAVVREGEERHNRSFVVGDNDYLATEAPRPSHLWLVSLERGAEALRLTDGIAGVAIYAASSVAWSPDGQTLAFTSQSEPHSGHQTRTSIKLLDVASGALRTVVSDPSYYDGLTISSDGQSVAYSSGGASPWWFPQHVFRHSLTGDDEVWLTQSVDRTFWDFRWVPGDNRIVAMANDLTRVGLWTFPEGGEAQRLDLGRANVSAFDVGRRGAVAFVGSESEHPSELYYMPSTTSPAVRLTHFNTEVAAETLGRVEEIVWDGPDGFSENGVLIYPPGYEAGKRYPLVLLIHGGPMGASTQSFAPSGQLMAAEGWVVFSPNYRGSDNMGRSYQEAVIDDAGEGPGRDVMAGIEAVKALGIVDESQIAVSGWSYGGYMTTWLIGHYDGWSSAVAGAAVTDYADSYNLSDVNVAFGGAIGGSPWIENYASDWVEQTPITSWKNMDTPTLILSNTGDLRVPITQSYKLYRALKENGREVEFIAYPIPGHFPGDPIHQRDVWRRWVEWIRDHFAAGPTGQRP